MEANVNQNVHTKRGKILPQQHKEKLDKLAEGQRLGLGVLKMCHAREGIEYNKARRRGRGREYIFPQTTTTIRQNAKSVAEVVKTFETKRNVR